MKAKELIEILSKNPELELGNISITQTFNEITDEEKHLILSNFVGTFGKFEAMSYGWTRNVDMVHGQDGLLVTLSRYNVCKIVGYKKEPVTDCDIKSGRIKEEEVIFSEAV